MKTLRFIFLGMAVSLFLATSALAVPYIGSLVNVEDGDQTLLGGGNWVPGSSLTWEVSKLNGTWQYSYTLSVPNAPDISHLIVEVSSNFTEANIVAEETTLGWELGTFSDAQGQSNPFIPGPIYGLKWDLTTDTRDFNWTIVTDRDPMWGDFYATGGNPQGAFGYVYNSEFGNFTLDPIADGNAGGWALVPNTVSVPEPGTLLLLGIGIISMSALGRRRIRR